MLRALTFLILALLIFAPASHAIAFQSPLLEAASGEANLAATAATHSDNASGEWREFRGPDGNGLAPHCRLPESWSEKVVAWVKPLSGRGWSSPVVKGQRAWMTAALETPSGSESSQKLAVIESIELIALCVDLETGEVVHQVSLFEDNDPVELHPLNSYASPTPVISGDRVICSFGDMGTACLRESDGTLLWKHDHFQLEHETGPGSSPIVWQDRILLNLDGTDRQSMAAIGIETGQVLWETARSGELHPEGMMKKAFCTPLLLDSGDQPVVVSPGANHVYGYDPRDGRELWRYTYGKLGFSNVPRPVFSDGLLLVCTGYNRASLLALRPGPSPAELPTLEWQVDQKIPTMPSPVVFEGRIYLVSDDGIASAFEVLTGKKIWQSRLGGNYSASPIVAGSVLLFGNRDGELIVVRPGEQFEKVGSFQLDSPIMATPVPVGEDLIVRTVNSLYRIHAD